MEQVDTGIVRHLRTLNTADRTECDAAELSTAWLATRLGERRRQMSKLEAMEAAGTTSGRCLVPINETAGAR